MATTALNPDAPVLFSSRHDPVPPLPMELLISTQNPNPHPFYYPFPIYIQVLTPQGVIYFVCPPGHYIPNQYLSFPPRDPNFQPDSPPSGPVLSRCCIKELDENSGTDQKSDTPDELIASEPRVTPLVLNHRRIQANKQCRAVIRPPRCQGPILRPPLFQEPRRRNFVKVSHRNYEISVEADFHCEGKTTLMIKNIPSRFSKEDMLLILQNHCIHANEMVMASDSLGDEAVLSEFDYFYLPIDFKTSRNYGFAFVNFTNPIGARRLYNHLHNHRWTAYGSSKVCAVNYARIQGLAESIAKADRLSFSRSIPDVYLPVHFEPACNGLNLNECEVIRHGRITM